MSRQAGGLRAVQARIDRQAGRTVKTEQCSQTLHIVRQVCREETNETARYIL
jgi:hypothetical protein